MAYSAEVMREARLRLKNQRRERELLADHQRREAYEARPRLRTLDLQLRTSVAQVMASAFQKRENPQQAIEQAKASNLAAQKERSLLLAELRMEDYLDTDAPCPHCGGTGWAGQTLCSCLRTLCREVQMEQFINLPGENIPGFVSFRTDLYSSQQDPKYGSSPRKQMTETKGFCEDWVRDFRKGSPSLLLTGGTGLGKTLLSACIGRSVTMLTEAGVVYTRATELLRAYEGAQFGNAEHPVKYEEADLLILDDLGTEMTTQFTNATLYNLLDGRLLAGRPTVISTNLPPDVLQQRYPPQLLSRLLGQYESLIFFGSDLRMYGR